MTTADLPPEQNLPGDSETEAAPGIVHRTGRAVRRLRYVSNQHDNKPSALFSRPRAHRPADRFGDDTHAALCFSPSTPVSFSVILIVYICFIHFEKFSILLRITVNS